MEVIPVALINQQKPLPNIRTQTFFVIDGRLDSHLLEGALDQLIRQHWRKLGARLVARPEDGRLEYHLPRVFAEDYALFNWSSTDSDYSIQKAGPSHLATAPAEEGVRLLPPLGTVEHLFRPADWPYECKDEPPNAPLLYVHLSRFSDASVVAISMPHSLGDQFGLATIMRAWLAQARGESPPPMMDATDGKIPEPPKQYAEYPREEIVRKGKMRIRRWGEYLFIVLLFIWDQIVHSKEVSYTMFLPRPLVAGIRERHAKTIVEKYGADPGISSGDIITGICLKLSHMHVNKPRKMNVCQALNMRGRISQLTSSATAFIHNAATFAVANLTLRPETPLSELAYRHRLAINETLDERELDKHLAILEEIARRGQSVHICEPFEYSYNFTNWSAAWKGLPEDFGTALEDRKAEKGVENPRMLVLGHVGEYQMPNRYSHIILCQTAEGFWCHFTMVGKCVPLVEEYIKNDPMLQDL